MPDKPFTLDPFHPLHCTASDVSALIRFLHDSVRPDSQTMTSLDLRRVRDACALAVEVLESLHGAKEQP